jgi:hypothetical protein
VGALSPELVANRRSRAVRRALPMMAALGLPLLLAWTDLDEPFATPTGPQLTSHVTMVEV